MHAQATHDPERHAADEHDVTAGQSAGERLDFEDSCCPRMDELGSVAAMTQKAFSFLQTVVVMLGVLAMASCGSNSTTPSAPTPQRTLVRSGTFNVSPQRATGVSFTTPAVGLITIVNTWGSAANQLTVQIGRAENCGAPQYTSGTCPWVFQDVGPSTGNSRTTSVTLSPAGNYIFWARNGGTTDETVTYQVYITP